jgi:hypothetical protein
VDVDIVRQAVELELIETPTEADRYLRAPTPAREPFIAPGCTPPPERLTKLRSKGLVVRPKARMTRRLLATGVVDRDHVRREA